MPPTPRDRPAPRAPRPQPPPSPRRHRERVAEGAVLVVVGVALVVNLVVAFVQAQSAPAVVAAVLSIAGVALLRRRPVGALVVVSSAAVVAGAAGEQPTGAWSIAVFVAFLLTLRSLPGVPVGLVVGATNLLAVALYEDQISLDRPSASVAAVCGVAAAALGTALRAQRRWADALEARAHDAVENRRAEVERGVAEERVRIARDLHDGIGHEIAVVSMHLGTAEVTLPLDAHATRASLGAAREAVRAVMLETQQVLRVLRVGDAPADLTPTPDHADVPRLVESSRAAGLVVDATLAGLDRPLPGAVSSATFRIVQELLTNAHRHGTGELSLRVEVGDVVLIEAVNVRAGATRDDLPGGGHGLVGIRERADSVGGRADHRLEGELFWVRAELPVPPPDHPEEDRP